VHVELLLESSYDSDQRLSLGAEVAFVRLAQRAVTYVWPRELRPTGALMHAKFLIVDESVALVTSANLTENGIDRNLELGVLIRNGLVPKALAGHVDHLIAVGTLRLVSEIR
jgi:phosphatidylserine/phosphatidylglycerophosphate/cardiolipin synthase-like enzyme